MRRTGGSTTSARGRARRGAPARLGSRRRGRADAEASAARLWFGNPGPEPACLNVLRAVCSSEATRLIAQLILLPAFDVGPQHTYRPRLVSRVTFTRKPPFTLTYHIRPAARWSDGVPVTARDFVFTHDARKARREDLSEDERQDLRRVRSVSKIDAKTVRVVLRARYSGWRTALFGNVLPAHALAGRDLTTIWNADSIDDPKTGRPIGSGPFLLESWDRGRQLTLIRNPRYWGAHRAYLDRLVIRFGTVGENAVDQFRSGEWDIAFGIFPDTVSALRRAGVKVLAEPSSGYQAFFFRTGPTGGHPALRGSRGSQFAAPLRTPLTAPRSSARAPARSTRTCGRSRVSSSRPRARITDRTGAGIAFGRRSRAACSSRQVAGKVSTASSPATASGSRFAS